MKIYPKGAKVWSEQLPICPTPSDIQKRYEEGFSGIYEIPGEKERFNEVAFETGGYINLEDAAHAYGWSESFAGQLIVPYIHVLENYPHCWPGKAQIVGNCVARSNTNAILGTLVSEIIAGKPDEITGKLETFPKVSDLGIANGVLASEPIYWQRKSNQHGWMCDRSASASIEHTGAVLRQNFPEIGIDLTTYTRANIERYGRTPPPENIAKHFRNNRIRTAARVSTFETIRDSLGQGRYIHSCGSEGFSSTRDSNAVSTRRGSWAHCVHPESIIAGQSFKKAYEVIVGDLVYGHDGKLHKVEKVHVRPGAEKLLVFKAFGMKEFKVTDEHPILIYRRVYQKNNFEIIGDIAETSDLKEYIYHHELYKAAWIRAKDVKPGDLVVTPKIKTNTTTNPSWIREENHNAINKLIDIKESKDLAWLFGLYIANGHATKAHKIVITMNQKNKDKQKIIDIMSSLGCSVGTEESDTYYRIIGYSAVLADSFIEWFGKCAHEKNIPDWLMTWDLKSVLDGYYTGDGHTRRDNRNMIASTVSSVLANQIFLCLTKIGEKPTFQEKDAESSGYAKEGYNCKDSYVINHTIDNNRTCTKDFGDYTLHKIKTITEENYSGLVYNYDVADVNSYVCDSVIVHNSMAYIGTDDRPEVVRMYNSPLVLILNSWGAWNTGNREIFDSAKYVPAHKKDLWIALDIVNPVTGNIMVPKGSFFALWRDIQRRQCFAFSGVNGWPMQKIQNWGLDLLG